MYSSYKIYGRLFHIRVNVCPWFHFTSSHRLLRCHSSIVTSHIASTQNYPHGKASLTRYASVPLLSMRLTNLFVNFSVTVSSCSFHLKSESELYCWKDFPPPSKHSTTRSLYGGDALSEKVRTYERNGAQIANSLCSPPIQCFEHEGAFHITPK